ncbi:CHAD domain-containing protein [Porifericola rhodea]|uniref:CHAD domain-containing protein n=1 Tax=Porifericola rhodea TaxID=930972 RepID=UPI0026668AF0|nr:CHAD domain-containing protein [Porifericola rhodea]WKN30712.1 CHAD domain-containing protein [Porifericola rhodea]
MSLRINLQETIPSNVERIMQSFLEDCKTSLQNDEPHKAIHQTRKNMKKMRAFCRLLRDEIGNKNFKKTNTFYRDVARQISEERDISAMQETLIMLHDELDVQLCGQAYTDIKNHFSSRKAAVTRLRINRDRILDKVMDDLKNADKYHQKWKVKNRGFDVFAKGVEITYTRCQKAMKLAYKKKDTEHFHEWRKRCKYLRYEVDFLRDIWKEPMSTLESELHQLTDYLGNDHDLAVLKSYIQGMQYENEEAIAAIFALIDTKRKEYQKLAKPLGQRILWEAPDQFVSRLASYWKYGLKEFSIKQEQPPLAVS